ncbi:unnamed protein product [Callosobruchus maculatus]|uniref:Uncharacterized protein n=1 Tax=Callosobruchus maculatus TaxID=64391 RepID=A0A653BW71_CALMS|nr:unnamed protein product [Callosobruchus maculatus]
MAIPVPVGVGRSTERLTWILPVTASVTGFFLLSSGTPPSLLHSIAPPSLLHCIT